MPIGELSGGNQQKCLIARALATNPRLLILDEPTRGIDVAGKQEIMNQLTQLAAQGMALLFISAEVEELLRVSTRIVVMRDRRQAGSLPGGCTEDQVYALIAAPAEAAQCRRAAIRKLLALPLFWPCATLALLIVLNAIANPGFLALAWRDGHLYGNLIDILNRAAPLALVSAGMTLVIAARGLDISVGAVVAIAAATGAHCASAPAAAWGWPSSRRWPSRCCAGCGTACWSWRVGMQPIIATLILMVAGRGVAQLITGGQIITIYYAPYDFIGNGFLFGLPFAAVLARGGHRGCCTRCSPPRRWGCSSAPSASTRWPRASPACARARSRCACMVSAGSWPGSRASSSVPTSRARTPTTPARCSSSTPSSP